MTRPKLISSPTWRETTDADSCLSCTDAERATLPPHPPSHRFHAEKQRQMLFFSSCFHWFSSQICFYFLLSVECNAALPLLLPPALLHLSAVLLHSGLSTHSVPSAGRRRKKGGGNAHWTEDTPSLVGQLMLCVHTENKQMLTENAAFLPSLLSGSPPPWLCFVSLLWLQPQFLSFQVLLLLTSFSSSSCGCCFH